MHISVTKETGWEGDGPNDGFTPCRKVNKRYRFILDVSLGSPEARVGINKAATQVERLKDCPAINKPEAPANFKELCCYVCGKTRSGRYHQQLQAKRGEITIPSLCRGCRRDRKVRISSCGRGEYCHRRVTRRQAHVDNREWCANCGVLRSERYHELYISGNLPPWSEICGKCKKMVKDGGERELRRMLSEELMKRWSSKQERGHADRHSQRRSRNNRAAPKHHTSHHKAETDRNQSSAGGIPTDDSPQKSQDHGEPTAVSAIRDHNAESSISTKGSQGLEAQEVSKAMAKKDTPGGGLNPALAEQQEPRKSSQPEKSDEGLKPCESEQVTQPQEKRERPGPGLPSATAADTQQHQKNHGRRRDSHRQRGSASQPPPPQPERQPQQQHRDNSRPKQSRPMGVSDMYWASEEGARESGFTRAFGFPGVYEYNSNNNCGHYHYGHDFDRPQQGVGATFVGVDGAFSAMRPTNYSCSESEDEAGRYRASSTTATTTSYSQGTTASSSSNSGRSRRSVATSVDTSPELGGAAAFGYFSAASTKKGRAGMPSPNHHRQQRTASRIWEINSAEAEEIEKAHVKLLGVKRNDENSTRSITSE
ncbi:GTPase Obg [Madurella fahalii]|uniref:GTPase Obg n=1 Tax=Madurella fahalii TaxID=1157608 RepID=A0ABQ0G0K6_9PEZI